MTEIHPGIYEITLSGPVGSAAAASVYLIRGNGRERSLLIDAGYDTPECKRVLNETLETLGVSPKDLDVFITHFHADHAGLAYWLSRSGARIYMNGFDYAQRFDCLYRDDSENGTIIAEVLDSMGVTEEAAPQLRQRYLTFDDRKDNTHPVWMNMVTSFPFESIQPGQCFCCGGYHLTAFALSGHTFGQQGLADEGKRIVFCADQLLSQTVPVIMTTRKNMGLLKKYLQSVDVLAKQYANTDVYPAHEGRLDDIAGAAERSKRFYQKKLEAMMAQLSAKREMTLWQIVRQMYHLDADITTDKDFYASKMMLTRNFSLLEYLHDTGKVQRREEGNTLLWSLKA